MLKYGILLIVLLITACEGHRDNFPMRNPITNEAVNCESGPYWFDEGAPQLEIAQACIHACELHGYRRYTGNLHTDKPRPQVANKYMQFKIPAQCRGDKL